VKIRLIFGDAFVSNFRCVRIILKYASELRRVVAHLPNLLQHIFIISRLQQAWAPLLPKSNPNRLKSNSYRPTTRFSY